MKKTIILASIISMFSATAIADGDYDFFNNSPNYEIDVDGAHAFINFKVNHLGFSWLRGGFGDFNGKFYYDNENPENSQILVNINVDSLNSNHTERDNHLRSEDFLFTSEYPDAKYVGTRYEPLTETTGIMHGDLTLRGKTNHVMINVEKIGQGTDPWGSERIGFTGTTEFKMSDFGIDYDLGEASNTVFLTLDIEGIKIN